MDWTNRAVCIDWDVNLFFSDDKLDQLFAQSICKSCPVRQLCEDHGDAEDFKYGVRAGYLRGTFKGAPRRAPLNFVVKPNPIPVLPGVRKNRAKDDWSQKYGKKCPQGHTHSASNTDRYGQCKECRRIYNKRRSGTLSK